VDKGSLNEQTSVRLDYMHVWMKAKIDLKELAKLRKSGLTFREIANRTGVTKTTVTRRLCALEDLEGRCCD
jgi:DNA-binding Lrp family transcriptional regulator